MIKNVIKCDRCKNEIPSGKTIYLAEVYKTNHELIEDGTPTDGLEFFENHFCAECYLDVFHSVKKEYDCGFEIETDKEAEQRRKLLEFEEPDQETCEKIERIENAKQKCEVLNYTRNLDIDIPNKEVLLELLGKTIKTGKNTFKYVYENPSGKWQVWVNNSDHQVIIGYYLSEIIAVRSLYSWIVENELEYKYFNKAYFNKPSNDRGGTLPTFLQLLGR